MDTLETKLKQKIRKTKIQKIILSSLYTAGILSMAVLAPNAVSLLNKFDKRKTRKQDPKYVINNAIRHLRDKGLVSWEENEHGVFLRLTKEGESAIDILERKEFKITRPKKWDGRWRVIVFDISERKKAIREKFRNTLVQIGFFKLQNSVWVYPYDCEGLITLVKADFKIGKEILYLIVDYMENDKRVKNYFGLN